MRDSSLVSQHAIIRRLLWYHPFSTPAQQRYLRVARKAPIEGGPTRGRVDSKPGLPTATTVGLPSDSSTTTEDLRGPPLPLSPLLDPDLLAARHRYKLPKPEPARELSAFQKKLRNNPYGTTAPDIYPTVLRLNGVQLKLLLHLFGNAPLLLPDSPSSSSWISASSRILEQANHGSCQNSSSIPTLSIQASYRP